MEKRQVQNPWPHPYPEPLAWTETRLLHGAIEQMLREGHAIYLGPSLPDRTGIYGAVEDETQPKGVLNVYGVTLAEVLSKLAEVVGRFEEPR